MTTQFVAGLNNTTTDDVVLFDESAVQANHQGQIADRRAMLERARTLARRERASKLGLGELSDG